MTDILDLQTDSSVELALLKDGYCAFSQNYYFTAGDLIRSKRSIGYYTDNLLAVILDVIDPPIVNTNENPENTNSQVNLDLLCGIIAPSDNGPIFRLIRIDSHFVEPWEPAV